MALTAQIYIFDLLGPFVKHPAGIMAEHLRDELAKNFLDAELFDCSDRIRLFSAITNIRQACIDDAGICPILHFFGHGKDSGIEIQRDNEDVNWRILAEMLQPLHKTVSGKFILCFDTCDGLHGFRVAYNALPLPFLALVGPNTTIQGDRTLAAFTEFYRTAFQGSGTMDDALQAMNQASGYPDERYEWIDGRKIGFDFTGKVKGIALANDVTGEIRWNGLD